MRAKRRPVLSHSGRWGLVVRANLRSVKGVSPSVLVAQHADFTAADLNRLIETYESASPVVRQPKSPVEIRPLISHHNYSTPGLFALEHLSALKTRTLTYLFAFDGITSSDPMGDISQLVKRGQMTDATRYANDVLKAIASVEKLIDEDLLRLTTARPALNDANRAAVLDYFGVKPSFGLLSYLVEAQAGAESLGAVGRDLYLQDVQALYANFRLPTGPLKDVSDGAAAVKHLGAALIQLSWQLTVCAADPSADIVLNDGIQRALLKSMLEEDDEATRPPPGFISPNAVGEDLHVLRHFDLIRAGQIPNFDPTGLNAADAIAIRGGDAFSRFRDVLHMGLDHYDSALSQKKQAVAAKAMFAAEMSDASNDLLKSVQKSSLRGRVNTESLPIALSLGAGTGATALGGGYWGPAAGAVGAAGGVLLRWLQGRPRVGSRIASRYCAMLSKSKDP